MATSAANWKRADSEELALPSGNTCVVRRPGMEKLLAAGVMPDNLTSIAMKAIDDAKTPGKPQDHKKPGGGAEIDDELMKEFLQEEGALEGMFLSFDKVAAMVIVEPTVRLHVRDKVNAAGEPIRDPKTEKIIVEEVPFSERDSDVIYTDDIDMDDKTFIFNFVVGGTRDLETFRKEYGDAMAALADGSNLEDKAE